MLHNRGIMELFFGIFSGKEKEIANIFSFDIFAYMPIITFKHNGTIYQRNINREERGIYLMVSKGKQYRCQKNNNDAANRGWQLVDGAPLPDFMMELISEVLENLNNQN